MRSIFAWLRSFFQKILWLIRGRGVGPVIDPDNGEIVEPEQPPWDVVIYYGCPNSKRAKRLQLEKKLYR